MVASNAVNRVTLHESVQQEVVVVAEEEAAEEAAEEGAEDVTWVVSVASEGLGLTLVAEAAARRIGMMTGTSGSSCMVTQNRACIHRW